MKNKSFFALLIAALMISTLACTHQPQAVRTSINYADTTYWYSYGDTTHVADVFYVYPTVLGISFADNGSSWFADITLPEVRKKANGNQRFNKMLYGEYNFYAPYYRQMIFDAYHQPILDSLAQIAAKDVKDAFQYYMAHYNHGRPFFLMGHSQGSQMLINLLKNGMTDEQRQLMVAAYCIGYHVTAEELADYPETLQPAMDSTETGKLIVFNSVTDTNGIGMVSRNDVVGINPTTWTMATDTISAEFHLGMAKYNKARDSVLIIPCPTRTYLYKHTTVCPDLDPEMVFNPAHEKTFPKGNLHFADSWLFGGNVVKNMRCRLMNVISEKTVQVKVMSYNVRHCAGMDMKVDYDRTAEVIWAQQPDVVALQELDSVTGRSGHLDQLAELANRTQYFPVFGGAIDFDGGKYGVGVLTREQPLSTKRIPLPGEEPRALLVVELQDYVVACTHLDLEEEQRLASVPLIVAEAQRWQKPFILAGDWNDESNSKLLKDLTQYFTIHSGNMATYPADKPQECIDYIATFKGQPAMALEYGVVNEPAASDHRPIVMRLMLRR